MAIGSGGCWSSRVQQGPAEMLPKNYVQPGHLKSWSSQLLHTLHLQGHQQVLKNGFILANVKKQTGEVGGCQSISQLETAKQSINEVRGGGLLIHQEAEGAMWFYYQTGGCGSEGRMPQTSKDLLHLLNIKQLLKVHHRYISDCNC